MKHFNLDEWESHNLTDEQMAEMERKDFIFFIKVYIVVMLVLIFILPAWLGGK